MSLDKAVKKQQRAAQIKVIKKSLKRDWVLYLFLVPVLLYVGLFCYWPMYGLQIAFQRFNIADGFSGSQWVGLYWIEKFVSGPKFWIILRNTLVLSFYSLLAGFP